MGCVINLSVFYIFYWYFNGFQPVNPFFESEMLQKSINFIQIGKVCFLI